MSEDTDVKSVRKRRALAAGISMTLLILGGYGVFRFLPKASEEPPVNIGSTQAEPLYSVDTIASTAKNRSAISRGKIGGAQVNIFSGIPSSRKDMPMNDDPFGPTSEEEKAWLDRNGYPNAKQLEAYSSASDSLLATAAASGDQIAEVTLASRRLMAGDPKAGDDLLASAVAGSGYALDLYAAYMAGSKSNGSVQAAYVLSRVAELRGNYAHAMSREVMLPRQPNQIERLRWGAEANSLFIQLQALHQDIYGNSSSWIDVRPMASKQAN